MSKLHYPEQKPDVIECFAEDMHPYNCNIETCPHQEAHEIYREWLESTKTGKRPYRRKAKD